MAIGAIFEGDFTQAQYEQVKNEVAPGNKVAAGDGLLYHAAGPAQAGFCVIEVWESKEALDRFFQTKLGASLERAGINVQPRFFDVVNTMTP